MKKRLLKSIIISLLITFLFILLSSSNNYGMFQIADKYETDYGYYITCVNKSYTYGNEASKFTVKIGNKMSFKKVYLIDYNRKEHYLTPEDMYAHINVGKEYYINLTHYDFLLDCKNLNGIKEIIGYSLNVTTF